MSPAGIANFERLRDEDLIRVAYADERDGYEDHFIAAARSEMERRGLSSSEIETQRTETAEIRDLEDANAEVPLGILAQVAFFVFGGNPIAWLFAYNLGAQGFSKKSERAFFLIGIKLALWLVSVILFLVSN